MSRIRPHTISYTLPKNIEHYLAVLSKLYAQESKKKLQEIIVNAQLRIHEAWTSDNWNVGTYGHALFLTLPESLYLSILKEIDVVRSEIKDGLNKLHNEQNEFIDEVFLEMGIAEDHDWRRESGLLTNGKRFAPPDAIKRIWGDSGFRVFLSHKSEAKRETADLKQKLALYGISSFVAHEDIHPTKAWQDEIENALASMDGFVALMTDKFHESYWTDQEVGYAVARGAPIIAVRLGTDPYGFIGKFQALSCTWLTAVEDIVKILIKNDHMLAAYLAALRKCPNWDSANVLAKVLPYIEKLTETQIDSLVSAYNETPELRGGFGFNGNKLKHYGPGLVHHLNRLGLRKYDYSSDWMIELAS